MVVMDGALRRPVIFNEKEVFLWQTSMRMKILTKILTKT